MTDFKPGDRVVYKAKDASGNPERNGNIGTVLAVAPNVVGTTWDDGVRVKWDPGFKGLNVHLVHASNLELFPAPRAVYLDEPVTTEYAADSHHDVVAHPSHYADGRKYEPKDVIRDWGLNFNRGSAVKYISRAGRKADELEDLRKARQFLDFEIEALEAEAL